MKSVFSLGIIASLLLGMTVSSEMASANPRVHHRVNHRQLRQSARIGQGINNGSLTRKETAKLGLQEQKLAANEQRMRASGGGLSAKEHCKLEKQQDALSTNIYQEKHDAQSK